MNPQILDSTALIFPDELPSPLRRKAKIYARKLPQDFFGCRRAAMSLDRQPHQLPPNRNEVHTQAYSRKVPELARVC